MSSADEKPAAPPAVVVQAEHVTVDVIDDRPAYLEAVAAIGAGTGPIAIDAERASGYRYSQRAYLIQVFRRGAGTFLFDPPAIGAFTGETQPGRRGFPAGGYPGSCRSPRFCRTTATTCA